SAHAAAGGWCEPEAATRAATAVPTPAAPKRRSLGDRVGRESTKERDRDRAYAGRELASRRQSAGGSKRTGPVRVSPAGLRRVRPSLSDGLPVAGVRRDRRGDGHSANRRNALAAANRGHHRPGLSAIGYAAYH